MRTVEDIITLDPLHTLNKDDAFFAREISIPRCGYNYLETYTATLEVFRIEIDDIDTPDAPCRWQQHVNTREDC